MNSLLYKILPALVLSLIFGGTGAAYAQVPDETAPEAEARISPVQVMIEQEAIANYDIPVDILTNLETNPGALKRPGTVQKKRGGAAVQKRQGYRIQVFSDGRNPSTLQARAKARGNAIVAKFPKYRGQVYSFSSAPNWYTRIGNFQTSGEANAALAELKRAFPAFAAEMRVVKSQITIIK